MMDQITQTANGYQVTIGGMVMSVPNDPANEDWQRVQEAIKSGHKVVEPQLPTIEELRDGASITRYQFCTACLASGILTADDAIAATRGDWPAPLDDFLAYLDDGQSADAQMEWAACVTIQRMHPFVLLLASWLGLKDEEVDAMFGIK